MQADSADSNTRLLLLLLLALSHQYLTDVYLLKTVEEYLYASLPGNSICSFFKFTALFCLDLWDLITLSTGTCRCLPVTVTDHLHDTRQQQYQQYAQHRRHRRVTGSLWTNSRLPSRIYKLHDFSHYNCFQV